MKAQYINQVKKHLLVSGKAKKEIVRDLEEIFASAAEHGEAAALVFAVFSVILYNFTKTPLHSVGIIGGADGPTTIILTNPNTPGGGGIFLIFAGLALILFVLMLVSLVRSKRKRG